MTVHLTKQVYGKSSVRLCKVARRADRHELIELDIDISLEGDFSESYQSGDNRRVIATDTMKNTIYALAADHPLVDAESFALAIASHFLDRHSHVVSVTIATQQTPWQRIETAGVPHRHSFVGAGGGRRISAVCRTRQAATVESGLTGLPLLKTADSAFRNFARDEFTTLADTDDRIFATRLDARWMYSVATVIDWNAAFERARTSMIAVFADHKSLAVQQTLFAMGKAALEACPEIGRIELSMSNEHRVPVNLEPFGRSNRNEVFVVTSEPFGLIRAVLEREGR
jgi:urate oxidase